MKKFFTSHVRCVQPNNFLMAIFNLQNHVRFFSVSFSKHLRCFVEIIIDERYLSLGLNFKSHSNRPQTVGKFQVLSTHFANSQGFFQPRNRASQKIKCVVVAVCNCVFPTLADQNQTTIIFHKTQNLGQIPVWFDDVLNEIVAKDAVVFSRRTFSSVTNKRIISVDVISAISQQRDVIVPLSASPIQV